MIVTIDGPSASGKTSVARELAQRLEFALLRTGAMYRALALAAHRHHWVSRHAEAELLAQLSHWHIDADETHVYLNGEDVSKEIEGQAMSQLSSLWAEVREVREHITGFIRQRAISYLAEGRSFIAEGRDQGSYVFPEAQCKFYIDADVTIRAARRLHDLQQRGENSLTISDMVKQLNLRDNRDRARHFAPLCVPQGAVYIDSSHLNKAQVVQKLLDVIRQAQERAA